MRYQAPSGAVRCSSLRECKVGPTFSAAYSENREGGGNFLGRQNDGTKKPNLAKTKGGCQLISGRQLHDAEGGKYGNIKNNPQKNSQKREITIGTRSPNTALLGSIIETGWEKRGWFHPVRKPRERGMCRGIKTHHTSGTWRHRPTSYHGEITILHKW